MQDIAVIQFQIVNNHPYLKALADLTVGGIQLRGLRLEEKSRGEFALGFPGRKIQGRWQVVYETNDRQVEARLLNVLGERYQQSGLAA